VQISRVLIAYYLATILFREKELWKPNSSAPYRRMVENRDLRMLHAYSDCLFFGYYSFLQKIMVTFSSPRRRTVEKKPSRFGIREGTLNHQNKQSFAARITGCIPVQSY
jgi:hypothetical protein